MNWVTFVDGQPKPPLDTAVIVLKVDGERVNAHFANKFFFDVESRQILLDNEVHAWKRRAA